jgi:hypothetical protein
MSRASKIYTLGDGWSCEDGYGQPDRVLYRFTMRPSILPTVGFILSLAESVLPAALPPQPTLPPNPLVQRGIGSIVGSLTSALPAEVTSYLASLPSDVLQGVLPAFEGLPDGDTIKSKLNITDDEIANEPLRILNIP